MRYASSISHRYPTSQWSGLLEELPQKIASLPETARILGGRNELYKLEHQGIQIAVKRFANKGVWKKFSYRIVQSKARRSYWHSLDLIKAGISSPQPIAWLEIWSGMWLQESYYLCEYVEVRHDATDKGLRCDSGLGSLKLDLISQSIAKMHEADLVHLDLNCGNWLYTQNIEGAWDVQLVDNNRMRKVAVSHSKGASHFVHLQFPEAEMRHLLTEYAKARRMDSGQCIRNYKKRIAVHRLNRRIRDKTRPWRRRLGL